MKTDNCGKNLIDIKNLIAHYEQKYQRPSHSVKLLAVSKKQSIEKILSAYHAGQTSFGENYLQEALTKIQALSDKSIEWHFIGPIQSNKTRKIAENFTWVETVANKKIAERLNDQRPIHLPPLNICIQVNISEELSKSGVHINEVADLIAYCNKLPRLNVRGIMTIPKELTDFSAQRNEFHKMKILFATLHAQGLLLDTLSMGMSHDFEAAIAEGATLVRIGTKIFGER